MCCCYRFYHNKIEGEECDVANFSKTFLLEARFWASPAPDYQMGMQSFPHPIAFLWWVFDTEASVFIYVFTNLFHIYLHLETGKRTVVLFLINANIILRSINFVKYFLIKMYWKSVTGLFSFKLLCDINMEALKIIWNFNCILYGKTYT